MATEHPPRTPQDSPGTSPPPARAGASLPDLVGELWELVRTYVRQETVDPIRNVGRFVAFGVAGAFLVGLGAVMLAVGSLRVLQVETGDTFDGNLTWVPYLIVFVGLLLGGALSLAAIGRKRSERSGS